MISINARNLIFLIGCIASLLPLSAREKNEKKYRVILLPEFFRYLPVVIGDTTFKYECFDHRNNTLNVNDPADLDQIDNIAFVKCYFQYPKTGSSPISPPYLMNKEYVYFKNDDGFWVGIDMVSNIKTGFKENKTQIVRADTVFVTSSPGGENIPVIHRYFRMVPVDMKNVKKHREEK